MVESRDTYTNALTSSGASVESTYGTASTGTYSYLPVQKNGLKQTNVLEKARNQDNTREVSSLEILQKLHRGPYVFRVIDGTYFKSSFGSLASVNDGGTYTHTFTTGNDLPSSSIYKQITGRGAISGIFEIYKGVKVDKMTLECQEQGFLLCTNDVLSSGKETATQKNITVGSAVPFKFSDIPKAEVDVNTGTKLKITSYKYTRSNNLSDEQEGDSIAEPQPQELDETLVIGAKMRGTALKTLQENGTEFPLIIEFEKSATNKIEITHTVKIKDGADAETEVSGEIENDINFEVKSTTLKVINSTASYDF